ncbi:MAG: peptide-methionine (R)-S-oxide reductase MsrB [Vicinamibacterales bacterium]
MTRSQRTIFVLAILAAAAVPAALTWKAHTTMPKDQPQSTRIFPVVRTDEEWRASLTPKQFAVLRKHDTEYPGTSPLLEEHSDGTFACAGCGQLLFTSETKYESGSGWPSFYEAIEGAIGTNEDRSLGMTRVEIHCSRCGGHLGHVFPDGPRPTGRRYCTNGAALTFEPGTR